MPVWPCKVATNLPPGASHSLTVPSSPPLATSRPSALSATRYTSLECPCRVANSFPVDASQSLTVLSKPPLATSCPSPLSATPIIGPVWP